MRVCCRGFGRLEIMGKVWGEGARLGWVEKKCEEVWRGGLGEKLTVLGRASRSSADCRSHSWLVS